MNNFCVIESYVQAVVEARTQFGDSFRGPNLNQTGSVPPPKGPVMVPTSHMFFYHPMKDLCVIEIRPQTLVWARTHFGDGL